MARVRPIQAAREIIGRGAGHEVTVGIMTVRQLDDVYFGTSALQPLRQRGCRLLAGMVGIAIEGNVELPAAAVAELRKLGRCQMGSESAGGVAKPRLPEYGKIEKSFDENDGRILVHRLPSKQTSLGAGQEPMGKGFTNTAPIEIDHAALLRTREDDTTAKRVAALIVD